MTAQAGAILNTTSTWDAVDWRTVEDNVRRLDQTGASPVDISLNLVYLIRIMN